jgi:hypothetical protein
MAANAGLRFVQLVEPRYERRCSRMRTVVLRLAHDYDCRAPRRREQPSTVARRNDGAIVGAGHAMTVQNAGHPEEPIEVIEKPRGGSCSPVSA